MTCSNDFKDNKPEFDITAELKIYGIIFGCFLAVLTATGNTLVVLAIYRTPALQSITNYFLVSLAVADLCVGIVALPVWLTRLVISSDPSRLSEANHLNVAVEVLYIQTFTASTYNLCAVSIDRYIAIKLPLRYHGLMTVKTFSWIVVCVWIFSILSGCLQFATNGGHSFWFITAAVAFFLPFGIIAFCYVYMLKEARRQKRNVSEQRAGPTAAEAHNRKAAVTVAIVIGVFLLFTLPMMVVTVTEAVMDVAGLCDLEERFETGSIWALLVSFSNSAVNPLIYGIRKREFKVAFKKILYRRNTVNEAP